MAVIKSFSDRSSYESWDMGKSIRDAADESKKAGPEKTCHPPCRHCPRRPANPARQPTGSVGGRQERAAQHPDQRPVSRLLRVAGWRHLRSRNKRLPLRQEKNVSFKNNGPAGWAVHPGEI